MTNTFNNKVSSPVYEQGQGYIFHVAGADFKITGSHIERVTETNDVYKALVAANNLFDINESGISFHYDFNKKQPISKIEEGATENFNNYLALTEKLSFLKESAKKLRVSGTSSDIISEVTKEIETVETAIKESKNSALAVRFSYDANNKVHKAGNIEITMGSEERLSERFFNIGYIKYADKSLIETFQTAAENFEAYKVLDFVTESKSGQITVATMKAEKNVFVYRLNEDTKLSTFQKMLANAAIEYVAHETGADVTEQFADLLEAQAALHGDKQKQINLYKEMLSFLYDQKGRLAEADRNLPDIKAADNLIETEIKRIKEDLEALESNKLGIEDGYVKASLKGNVDGLPENAELMVDAVEYNQAGKNDILTVFVEDKPFRVEKYKINISEEDNL